LPPTVPSLHFLFPAVGPLFLFCSPAPPYSPEQSRLHESLVVRRRPSPLPPYLYGSLSRMELPPALFPDKFGNSRSVPPLIFLPKLIYLLFGPPSSTTFFLSMGEPRWRAMLFKFTPFPRSFSSLPFFREKSLRGFFFFSLFTHRSSLRGPRPLLVSSP